MMILLIGPKGGGKSHVGRLLSASCGVHFFHVEPLWQRYHAACAAEGRPGSIPGGLAEVLPALEQALRTHDRVSVETTGASAEILDALLRLGSAYGLLLVKVWAPLRVCRERIATRDPTHHLPATAGSIREVHARSEVVSLPFDLVLENATLGDEEILGAFRAIGLAAAP